MEKTAEAPPEIEGQTVPHSLLYPHGLTLAPLAQACRVCTPQLGLTEDRPAPILLQTFFHPRVKTAAPPPLMTPGFSKHLAVSR